MNGHHLPGTLRSDNKELSLPWERGLLASDHLLVKHSWVPASCFPGASDHHPALALALALAGRDPVLPLPEPQRPSISPKELYTCLVRVYAAQRTPLSVCPGGQRALLLGPTGL